MYICKDIYRSNMWYLSLKTVVYYFGTVYKDLYNIISF